jgi:hypothetical protein
MHPTELSDRLAQLNQRLDEARATVQRANAAADECKALAAEQDSETARVAYTAQQCRHRGIAMHWENHAAELVREIAGLEAQPVLAPVLTVGQRQAADEMAGVV